MSKADSRCQAEIRNISDSLLERKEMNEAGLIERDSHEADGTRRMNPPDDVALVMKRIRRSVFDELKGDNLLEAALVSNPARKADASATSAESDEFEIDPGEHRDAD